MSKWVKTLQPCPCGKSSDAYSEDVNGNGFCFGQCGGKFFKGADEFEPSQEDLDYVFLSYRGINKQTMEFYGTLTKTVKDVPIEQAFFYPKGEAIKFRHLVKPKRQSFRTEGLMSQPMLFGMDKFPAASKASITITEGEYDAHSIYQVTHGETAAVSLKSSSSAFSDLKGCWDYVNSFDKIIFAFDNDDAGHKALKDVAGMFDFKKVYILDYGKRKDANEFLQNKEGKELYELWRRAKRYTPDNIKSTFNEFAKALEYEGETQLLEYPFKKLNEMLRGIHASEVVVIKGLEGIGKTEIMKAIEYNGLKSTKHPIGIIHLEEDNSVTLRSLATYELKVPANDPTFNVNNGEIIKTIKNMVDQKEDRLFLHESFDVEEENMFIDNVRYLASVCGCKVIFFDHISWLATGGDNEDERKKLDRISQRLKLLAKELRFALVMISHVNDDGKTRGSRNITKVANTVLQLSRSVTHPDPDERVKLWIIIEKSRGAGTETGPAGYAVFDSSTGRLIDDIPQGSIGNVSEGSD